MRLIEHLQGKSIGHPTHPLIVRFPAALLPTSLLFDLISVFIPSPVFTNVAYYTLIVGLIGAFIAMLFGLIDFIYEIPRGTRISLLAGVHGLLNATATILFLANFILRQSLLGIATTPAALILLSIIGVSVMSVSGYIGGRLIFHYGFRVDMAQKRLLEIVKKDIKQRAA